MNINKRIYEDVLDDIERIEPDVPEEDEAGFVSEPFDTKPYRFFVKVRIPTFTSTVPADSQVSIASQISDFIGDVFADNSIVEKISPIYACGNADWFGKTWLDGPPLSPLYSGLSLIFGVMFGVVPTFKQCIRFMLRLDAVDEFIRAADPEINGSAILNAINAGTIFDDSLMLSVTAGMSKSRHPVLVSLTSAVNGTEFMRNMYADAFTAACRAMRGCREPEDGKHLIEAIKSIVSAQ